jgi:hypothetical protein
MKVLPLGLVVVTLAGCSRGPAVVRVEGKVTLNDQPLTGAVVTYHPDGNTPGDALASGRTDETGQFTLRGRSGSEGAMAGSYKVTISKWLRKDGSVLPEGTPPMDSDARESIPAEWSDVGSTKLRATVAEGSEPAAFHLKATAK